MASNARRLQYLFQKYLEDEGTPEEINEFWNLFSEVEENDPVRQDLWRLWRETGNKKAGKAKDWDLVLNTIHQRAAVWERRSVREKKQYVLPRRIAAAVVVVCLLGAGGYLWNIHGNEKGGISGIKKSDPAEADIKPGGNKAVLMLANGRTIFLDSMHRGQLATQGNSKIVKVGNGLLVYGGSPKPGQRQRPGQYNVLTTPPGGEYRLVLPDGTKVWLNASSSIRFPTVFTGGERSVTISGEVYFEVAKNENKPFKVKSGDIEIDVLGTSFNVNTYKDEPAVKVTLLAGSVRIVQKATRQSKLMQPGEQASVDHHNNIRITGPVNTSEVIAWKNGLFWFDDDDIQTVMRKISRWYNVDVEINGTITQHFTGSIPRGLMVSGVFEVLERTGKINFKIEDKKIIVSP